MFFVFYTSTAALTNFWLFTFASFVNTLVTIFCPLTIHHRSQLSNGRQIQFMILVFHLSSCLDPAFDAFVRALGSMHCCTASPSQLSHSPAPSFCRSSGRLVPGLASFLLPPSANAQHVTFQWSWKGQERQIFYVRLFTI